MLALLTIICRTSENIRLIPDEIMLVAELRRGVRNPRREREQPVLPVEAVAPALQALAGPEAAPIAGEALPVNQGPNPAAPEVPVDANRALAAAVQRPLAPAGLEVAPITDEALAVNREPIPVAPEIAAGVNWALAVAVNQQPIPAGNLIDPEIALGANAVQQPDIAGRAVPVQHVQEPQEVEHENELA